MADRAVAVRLLLLVLATAYLVVGAMSHLIPLDSSLDVLLVVPAWLVLAVLGLLTWGNRRRGMRPPWRDIVRPWPLTALFAVVAAAALAVSLVGNPPLNCPGSSPSICYKIDGYRIAGDHFYRHHPFDAAGNIDPNQPWVEITMQTYVDEIGTKLRSAATFGLVIVCASWLTASGLNAVGANAS